MARFALFALLVAGVGLAADDAETKEQAAVAGVWVVEKAEMGGADITPALKGYVLTLKADSYVLDDKGKLDKGTMKLDGSKSPKWLDLSGGPGSPHQGKVIPCLYEVKAGKLTVCYGLDYKARPAAFETKKGTKQLLATYKPKAGG